MKYVTTKRLIFSTVDVQSFLADKRRLSVDGWAVSGNFEMMNVKQGQANGNKIISQV